MAEPATAPKDKAPKPDLAILKKMFDDSRQATNVQQARRLANACRDYYDGEQLSSTQRAILKLRKQPDVVINRTRRAIDGTLGVVEQGKTDPRAYMRNPPELKPPQATPAPPMGMQPGMGHNGGPPMQGQAAPPPDLDAGDVASMTLRYVADRNRFQTIKLDVLEYLLIEGTAGAITEFKDGEIAVTLISFDEYFYDPRARKADLSDKRYDGIAKWMYADDLAAIYPEAKADIENAITHGDAGLAPDESWEDKPDSNATSWVDQKQRRVMAVDMYYREGGTWNRAVFHAGGVLEAGPSAYLDDKGRPRNPIEGQSIYIDRKLVRYGLVKDMIDIQDEINSRRSKAIHEISLRQIQQDDPNAPPIDVDDARAEAARPDGVLPPGWKIVPRQDIVANSIEMLQEAKSELERLAPNPALLGRQGADASGRAQQLRAQAGMVELSRPLGRFTSWEHRIYANQIWPCARQFFTDPMWVRVTDDDGAAQFVKINEPAPVDPMTGQPALDPKTGQPVIKNHVAQMDVDIVVDSVPDTATLEQEIWSDMVKLAETYGPQAVPFDVVIEMSPLPEKQRVIKKLKQAQAEAAQANAQQIALQTAAATADVAKTQSETEKNTAQAKKTEIEGVKVALDGHMAAHSAQVLPPGMADVANLPQNQPQQPMGTA